MRLLLDTCTFLWFITANERLPPDVRKIIQSPDHEVWLSAVSFWEIQVKHQLGRLSLSESPASYVPRQRKRHGIDSLALLENAVGHLTKLPDRHRDPFDRMLICQAIDHGLTIVTPDSAIHSYPVKVLWGA
jgi:PIN domain nuclease of toxin-antitoxin system